MLGGSSKRSFRLGRYDVTRRIASGGMATVYRGRRRGRGGFRRDVALKVIHPHLSSIDGFMARLMDEASVASRIHHPNVCAVIDIDAARGYHFLVLELIDGVTIRQTQNFSHVRMVLPAEEAARVIADAARGLAALHALNVEEGRSLEVVHRDISPHNLMLDTSGRTVLIDLGLAAARDRMGHTQTGVLVGKLPYMSPEQTRLGRLDPRSDIFSLGSVLFELLTGAPPFGDEHTPDTLSSLRTCKRERLLEVLVSSGSPAWINDVILGCLHASASDRYQDAAALANDLERGIFQTGIAEQTIRTRLARRARDTQKAYAGSDRLEELPPAIQARLSQVPPMLTALAIVGVLALGFLGIYTLTGTDPEARPGADTGRPSVTDMTATPARSERAEPLQRESPGATSTTGDAPDRVSEAAPPSTEAASETTATQEEAVTPSEASDTASTPTRKKRRRRRAPPPAAESTPVKLQVNPYE